VRSAGGEIYVGRFISARAYEAYARGALFEAEGRADAAITSFREAADFDAKGPEPWTRLGALLCRKKSGEADGAFDAARDADATFAPLHRELARCHLARKELSLALEESALAIILDPSDDDAWVVHVDALLANGQNEQAERELVARALLPAASEPLMKRLAAIGRASKKPGLERLARCAASDTLGAACQAANKSSPRPGERTDTPTLAEVDNAIERGDLRLARRVAMRAKLNQGELALRAAALGRFDIAKEQASLVALADPTSVEGRVALLISASPQNDVELYSAATDFSAAGAPRSLSRLERLLLAEAVGRAAGSGAASAVLAGEKLDPAAKDPAEARVSKRIAAWLTGQ